MLLAGEPGIGKSRLTAALLKSVAPERRTRLRYFCSPHHTDSAFYPVIGQMERAAGLAYTDTPKAKLDKLDALLALTSTSTEDVSSSPKCCRCRTMAVIPRVSSPPNSVGKGCWKRSLRNCRRSPAKIRFS